MPKTAPNNKRRADNDEDLVGLYLEEIGRYELLTKDGEVRLARQIEAGVEARAELGGGGKVTAARRRQLETTIAQGEEAARQFANANLRLVVSIARKYQASGVPLLDLIQEGNLGLIHAVEKFDWRKGFKFSTYATWWIRQAIQRGIANSGRTIRLPVHAGDRLARVEKARWRLEGELGRPPGPAELAAEVGLTEVEVADVLRFAAHTRSLSEQLSEDSDTELGDMLADAMAREPFEAAAETMLTARIERMFAALDTDERRVLQLRFGLDQGDPRLIEEVARDLGLPREDVRRIEDRALAKLRHPCCAQDLRDLLAAG